jgi:hypothetical protein
MAKFRLVKIFEAESIDEALKNEKRHKPIKVEELEDEELEAEYNIGYGRK